MVREQWEEGEHKSQSTVQQVLEMREHLRYAQGAAKQALGRCQENQKRRYDNKVRERILEPGDKVLLLLPAEAAKLFAQ